MLVPFQKTTLSSQAQLCAKLQRLPYRACVDNVSVSPNIDSGIPRLQSTVCPMSLSSTISSVPEMSSGRSDQEFRSSASNDGAAPSGQRLEQVLVHYVHCDEHRLHKGLGVRTSPPALVCEWKQTA